MKFKNIDNFLLTRHAIERYSQRYGWGTYNICGLKRKIIRAINKNITKCNEITTQGHHYWHVPSLNLRLITKKDFRIHKDVIVTIIKNDNSCQCNLMKELQKFCNDFDQEIVSFSNKIVINQ